MDDDELERMLGRALSPEPLAPPEGAYGRARQAAARRRRSRAALGGLAAVGVVVLAVPFVQALGDGGREVVLQPAEQVSAAPPATEPEPSAAPAGEQTPPPDEYHPPGPPPGYARCGARDLELTLGGMDAAAGNRYLPLVLRNVSAATCHLQGYPGVSLLDADRNQLGPAVTYEDANPKERLDLGPDEAVSTVLHWASDGNAPCRPESAYVRVYPPGDTESIVVPLVARLCEGDLFAVRNLVAGTTGMALEP